MKAITTPEILTSHWIHGDLSPTPTNDQKIISDKENKSTEIDNKRDEIWKNLLTSLGPIIY